MSLWLLIFLALLEVGWSPWRDPAHLHRRSCSVLATEPPFAVSKGPARSAIAQPPRDTARRFGSGAAAEHLRPPSWVASPLPLVDLGREKSGAQVRAPAPPDSHLPTASALDRAARRVTCVPTNVIEIGPRVIAEPLPTLPCATTAPPTALFRQLRVSGAAAPSVKARDSRGTYFCNNL